MIIQGSTIQGVVISELSSTPSGGNLRAVLSAAGQATYDSATAGNFFEVSATDYEAVSTSLTNVTKKGYKDTASEMNANNAQTYSGTCASILDLPNATISVNNYILGFSSRVFTAIGTFTLLSNISFRGTYTAVSNSPNVTTTARAYYIRKDPPTPVSNTTYYGIVTSTASFRQGSVSLFNANANLGPAFDCDAPYSTWNNRSGTMPLIQVLITPDKQW